MTSESDRMLEKTIAVRDDDVALWNRAEQLAGGELSGILTAALKQYVDQREAGEQAMGQGNNRIAYMWGSHSFDGQHKWTPEEVRRMRDFYDRLAAEEV